ncbi:GNAT family N-acetyltransferase [Streptomyces sp. T-3]|nr:GNAT family N-acetyltransferase [Streptomyces sp. T-3]
MLKLAPAQLPPLTSWFAASSPGPAALPEHVRSTGVGQWWADRALEPRVLAVSCGDQVLLRGNPDVLGPDALAVFAERRVVAPARFLPVLGASFERVVPWERMVYVHASSGTPRRAPRGVTVRALTAQDSPTLTDFCANAPWLYGTWGEPSTLAASGHAVGAFRKGALLSVACTHLRGDAYEDIAVATAPEHRGRGLALACVTALCQEIAARGATPSWTCSRDNRPSRLLAWTAGFRLRHEYVHHLTGQPAGRGALAS